MPLDRTLVCSGHSLRVLDLRSTHRLSDVWTAKSAAFGSRTRIPLSISGVHEPLAGNDAAASRMIERLYREALRMLNAYDAAEGSVDHGLGGSCRQRPIGIALYDYGAEIVAADEMRVAFYQD